MKSKLLIFCLLTIFIFSCDKIQNEKDYDDYSDDCSGFTCDTIEPLNAYIEIKFSRTSETENPDIYIYTDYYENRKIYDTLKTDSISDYYFYTYYNIPVNQYYTIIAEYHKGADTIYAIDGDFIYTEMNVECGYNCWKIKNKYFNVSLKK